MTPRQPKKFTLILDSSQVTEFLSCPQRWCYRYKRRLEPVGTPEKQDAMNGGTYGHKLMDIYYRARFQKYSLNDAVAKCFAYNPDVDTCECGCAKEHHTEIEVLHLVECSRCKKCYSFRPKPFPLDEEIRSKVRNRFREYCFKYSVGDILPLSERHVEVGFSEILFEDKENLFVIEGRIDLIGCLQGLNLIMDHKFQFKQTWLYQKSVQFKTYAMVAKAPLVMINYVRLHKEITPDTMSRDIISFNVLELRAWHTKLIQIFFQIKESIQWGHYNHNWSACSGYYETYKKEEPRYCWYRDLCEEHNDKLRELKENQLFQIKKEVWKPW